MKPKSLLLHKCIGAVLLILCMFSVVTNSYAQDKTLSGTVKDENGLPVPGVNVVEKGTIHGSITDQHGKYSLHVENNLVVITPYSTLQHTVTGRVTSEEDGSGIPGVSILIKGTTQGTATDVDGNYKLNAPSEDAVLVFSSIGYLQQEITVGTQSVINVVLAPDIIKLEEVVVIGYGTVKKSDLTGSVSQVSNENFNKGIYASIDQAVIGRAAGVQIRQTSGEPGGGMSTRIRGASSINASNEPLYVIDGLPIDNNPTLSIGGGAGTDSNPNPKNPLNSLNPNDIESLQPQFMVPEVLMVLY